MRIAILGASSQIAKDLVLSFCAQSSHELLLYARRPEVVSQWLASVGLVGRYGVADFAAFNVEEHFDAILNFVGVGNPAQAAAMGASIFDVTLKYDELALDYVRQHPGCRYIFLSSGAAYGSSFAEPVDADTKAVIEINNLQPQDWYGIAKLHAECRHRSLPHFSIIDIRVFNYFSHTQDITARFFITDIARAIRDKVILYTTPNYIVRDYITPKDFHRLVNCILFAPADNYVIDCYTRAPIDKFTLLNMMNKQFGLIFNTLETENCTVNATGSKPHYYSINSKAAKLGYQPEYSSEEGIHVEMLKMLNTHA
jgi:nucleoside-diphosphate-sugar epimerase